MWNLPNLLTLCNLLAGLLGIYFVLTEQPQAALIAMGVALLADYLDGWAARWLDTKPWIGKDLDSLADIVSFGALPSFMLLTLWQNTSLGMNGLWHFLPFASFAFALFGALRLAKFNQDTRVADHFFGLPIPAAAVYLGGLFMVHHQGCTTCSSAFINPLVLSISLIFLCFLMVSDLPHFNLKFRSLHWKGQEVKWIYLIVLVPLTFLLHHLAVPCAIVLYIFLSLIQSTFLQPNV